MIYTPPYLRSSLPKPVPPIQKFRSLSCVSVLSDKKRGCPQKVFPFGTAPVILSALIAEILLLSLVYHFFTSYKSGNAFILPSRGTFVRGFILVSSIIFCSFSVITLFLLS